MENRKVMFNSKTNLLQLEEPFYQLVENQSANVYRNLFPYTEVPRIAFNDRIVPHCMPDEIWITDTTFRDGQQSVRVNSFYIAKKTVMRFINVWKEVMNFQKSHPGFVQVRRISSL